ncbi:NAD(P)H-binding protein [Maritimibacter sp. UBA3975]|uniref:NAD(P)-dependent oxidoreductase n=1 Tax=Maritimibacter sp. UBA3975 TaxID=1946833 RepID=UPI000C0A6600|nr:NAD(P)H-binding protein [Maritimibacter sp. UBA3975]MAM62823.1 short-chain dehydrogenase [Maritimibacter sp.]|tara:strand:+ start:14520 stop:15224 length:705 start_codon:yes stop_codon:yes gene_type:complete
MKRICIIGISGKLGLLMAQHSLAEGYAVTGLCRPGSASKLSTFGDSITVMTGDTSDPATIARAVAGCDGVLTVLVPWGTDGMATRTAGAVLEHADPGARLVFSTGWHAARDDRDRYGVAQQIKTGLIGRVVRLTGMADIADHKRAARLVYSSDRDWTVVRAADLEEGESEGLPVWAPHVGDPVLKSNRVRPTDFALFMVHALTNPALVREAPAIVGRASASVAAHHPGATARAI